MEEKTRKNLEQTANDCLDRAYACDPESEDYMKLISKATAICNVLNDEKKIDCDKEVELKKIEQNGEITKKDYFIVGVPLVGGALGYIYKSWDWMKKTKFMCKFETESSFTSTVGRSLWKEYLSLFNFKGRRH